MRWFVKKVKDDGITVVYAYGYEVDVMSGKISYNRDTEKFDCVFLADGDTETGFNRLCGHIWNIVTNEDAPNERMIVTG